MKARVRALLHEAAALAAYMGREDLVRELEEAIWSGYTARVVRTLRAESHHLLREIGEEIAKEED